jgi:hypothetical protein
MSSKSTPIAIVKECRVCKNECFLVGSGCSNPECPSRKTKTDKKTCHFCKSERVFVNGVPRCSNEECYQKSQAIIAQKKLTSVPCVSLSVPKADEVNETKGTVSNLSTIPVVSAPAEITPPIKLKSWTDLLFKSTPGSLSLPASGNDAVAGPPVAVKVEESLPVSRGNEVVKPADVLVNDFTKVENLNWYDDYEASQKEELESSTPENPEVDLIDLLDLDSPKKETKSVKKVKKAKGTKSPPKWELSTKFYLKQHLCTFNDKETRSYCNEYVFLVVDKDGTPASGFSVKRGFCPTHQREVVRNKQQGTGAHCQ